MVAHSQAGGAVATAQVGTPPALAPAPAPALAPLAIPVCRGGPALLGLHHGCWPPITASAPAAAAAEAQERPVWPRCPQPRQKTAPQEAALQEAVRLPAAASAGGTAAAAGTKQGAAQSGHENSIRCSSAASCGGNAGATSAAARRWLHRGQAAGRRAGPCCRRVRTSASTHRLQTAQWLEPCRCSICAAGTPSLMQMGQSLLSDAGAVALLGPSPSLSTRPASADGSPSPPALASIGLTA